MVLFNTIDVYTAIKLNIGHCLGGSVGRTRKYCTFIFSSSALLVRILHATFIFVTTLKTFVLFLLNFLLLQNCFSILTNLISLVTLTFTRRIHNTVLQLSPVASSVLRYELRHDISNNVTF